MNVYCRRRGLFLLKSSGAVLVCEIQEATFQLKQFKFLFIYLLFRQLLKIILWLHNCKIKVRISYPSWSFKQEMRLENGVDHFIRNISKISQP